MSWWEYIKFCIPSSFHWQFFYSRFVATIVIYTVQSSFIYFVIVSELTLYTIWKWVKIETSANYFFFFWVFSFNDGIFRKSERNSTNKLGQIIFADVEELSATMASKNANFVWNSCASNFLFIFGHLPRYENSNQWQQRNNFRTIFCRYFGSFEVKIGRNIFILFLLLFFVM